MADQVVVFKVRVRSDWRVEVTILFAYWKWAYLRPRLSGWFVKLINKDFTSDFKISFPALRNSKVRRNGNLPVGILEPRNYIEQICDKFYRPLHHDRTCDSPAVIVQFYTTTSKTMGNAAEHY